MTCWKGSDDKRWIIVNYNEWWNSSDVRYADMPIIMWDHALRLGVSSTWLLYLLLQCKAFLSVAQNVFEPWGCGEVFPLSSGNYVFSYFGIVTFQDCFNQLDVEPIGWNCVDLHRAACVSDGFSVCGHLSGFCWLCGEVLGERCLVSAQGASASILYL